MNEITIRIDEIKQLASEGGKLVFKKEAEQALLALLEWQQKIDEMIQEVKKQIAEAGKSISPDFKGVIGERVKAIYRFYGEKYEHDKSKRDALAPFLKSVTYYKVNSEAVETFTEKEGKLPDGIREKEREPILSLSIIKPQLENGKKEQ